MWGFEKFWEGELGCGATLDGQGNKISATLPGDHALVSEQLLLRNLVGSCVLPASWRILLKKDILWLVDW